MKRKNRLLQKKILLLILFTAAIFTPSNLAAQAQPELPDELETYASVDIAPEKSQTPKLEEEVTYGFEQKENQRFLIGRIFYKITYAQTLRINRLKKYLSENTGFSIPTAVSIFFMTFMVGLLYSMLPGNGKIYALSYFMAKDSPIADGIKYAYFSMIVHIVITFMVFSHQSYVLSREIDV
ncbi:MAG TPA: hypothetical protein VMW66_02650, partial [Elusimicrobiales bacterium]|nr:hypothetical protein [Elusimicrobiales bacterium]